MKKSISAFVAAVLVTGLLAGAMFLIGQDAFGTSAARAEAAAATTVPLDTTAQYEQIVKQYQAREAQYQAEIAQAADQINTANEQLSTANQQIQQYQSLLEQLQSTGLVTIASDGSVTVNQASQPGFLPQGDHHGGNH